MTRSYFGSIERIGPDYYRVWWTDKSGKRRSHRMPDTTRDEAEAYLAARNLDGMPKSTTWRQLWHAKAVPQIATLAERTRHEYHRNWERYLEPAIGDEPVSDMDWHRANEVITSMDSPSVQRQVGKLLKKLCNMAIRDRGRLLAYNPVDRAIEYKPYRPKPKKLVDAESVGRYMEAAKGSKHEAVILALMGFGMRPEEAYALTWEDIRPYEFKGATYCVARVDKALTWGHVEGKIFKETKNEASDRDAVCGEPWASRLLELSEGKTGPLCPSGAPYDESDPAAWYTSPITIAHNWKLWCGRRGIDYVAPRNLRSSYSTMMGEAMVPDSVVDANMGHAPSGVKQVHYQRVTMRAKCMAADMLADLVAEFG